MSTDAIVLRDVTKRYGATTALDGLDVSFPAGRLTGFLGPNGAGKTTTFRACLGLTRPQRGRIEVLGMAVGRDTPRIVKAVGAVVEEPGLHRALSGLDNMRIAAHTLGTGHDEIEPLLEFVELSADARRKVGGYSKGMRQRLALAMAMLGDPPLLLLDEPLDGLDPAGQVSLKRRLRSLVDEQGKTIVVSSHDLADIEELADHLVVISRGALVATGTVEEVIGGATTHRIEIADPARAAEALAAAGFELVDRGDGLRAIAADGADLARALAAEGLYPSALVPERESLERVFLELTGGGS